MLLQWSNSKNRLKTNELIVYAMLATIMYLSKIFMEWAPNIHLLSMLTMSYTLVYRQKALYPIYVYVLINGVMVGFSIWWVPYLYVWTVLWGVTMLLPRKMKTKVAVVVYCVVCGLHGLLFGVLYAPSQALFFGLNFEGTVAWVIAGLPFDIMHSLGNLGAGVLILPLVSLLKRIEQSVR